MEESRKKKKRIVSCFVIIVMLIILVVVYTKYDYNFYTKGVEEVQKTSFTRDSGEKVEGQKSYKVENKEYNDAMFYQEVKVIPHTPYRVSCMVKTKDIVTQDNNILGGALIAIEGTTEASRSLSGTNDWTKIEFLFNSQNRTSVKIGFRLGGYETKAKGTAWFSDMKIESGIADTTEEWNFACFIMNRVAVESNQEIENTIMTQNDVATIRNCVERFRSSMEEMSNRKIKVRYDIIEIEQPITTISYDKDNGYYIGPKDVYSLIDSYVKEKNYDHIFICSKLEEIEKEGQQKDKDWVGLGAMDYFGIGFSNMRLPKNIPALYVYGPNNQFPEEVFVHEFLHTLERNSQEHGYERPRLHDYTKYGYQEEAAIGLKRWYEVYMNQTIRTREGNIGLNPIVYTLKPAKTSEFQFSYEMEDLKEPTTIKARLDSIIYKVKSLFQFIAQKE